MCTYMYTNAHTHTLTNTERNICKKSLKSEQHKRYAQVANRNTDTPSNHSFKTNRLNQSTDNFSGFPHNGSIHRRDGQSECGLRDASGQHSRQRPGEPRRRRFHPHRVRFVLRLQPLSGGQYIVRGSRTACTQNRTKHHRKCQKTGGRHGERQAATTSDLTGLYSSRFIAARPDCGRISPFSARRRPFVALCNHVSPKGVKNMPKHPSNGRLVRLRHSNGVSVRVAVAVAVLALAGAAQAAQECGVNHNDVQCNEGCCSIHGW